MKDLFIKAHEELVAEYLEQHSEATWEKAYEATAEAAYERMRDVFFDSVDR